MTRYTDLSPFTRAFSAEFKGYMASNGITHRSFAAELGRNNGYVSERVNGQRALDTEDVDVLARMTGTTGRALIIELARRAHERIQQLADTELPRIGLAVDPETAPLDGEQLAASHDWSQAEIDGGHSGDENQDV